MKNASPKAWIQLRQKPAHDAVTCCQKDNPTWISAKAQAMKKKNEKIAAFVAADPMDNPTWKAQDEENQRIKKKNDEIAAHVAADPTDNPTWKAQNEENQRIKKKNDEIAAH